MTTYSISGTVDMGRKNQKFEKQVESASEQYAEEMVKNQIGSEHSVKQTQIEIQSTEEISSNE